MQLLLFLTLFLQMLFISLLIALLLCPEFLLILSCELLLFLQFLASFQLLFICCDGFDVRRPVFTHLRKNTTGVHSTSKTTIMESK
jgi:hypothetical protein